MQQAKRRFASLGLMIILLTVGGCGNGGSQNNGGANSGAGASKVAAFHIKNWGPKSTKAGIPFNKQPNGNAAFWVKVGSSAEGTDAELVFAGHALPTAIQDNLLTAQVSRDLYGQPGKYALQVKRSAGGKEIYSQPVYFRVTGK